MKKLVIVLFCLFASPFLHAGEHEYKSALPEKLTADESLLVQCFSYFTPGSINLPMGTLTVAGLLPSDPHLTVTFTQLLGAPITGTLHGIGKRTPNGVVGTIEGTLSQFGGHKIWVKSDLKAVYPSGGSNGTLSMPKLGSLMELKDGCSS
ncbi:MAG: hypothetical protein AAF431_18825 [Pseudomonadota bacterium]